MTSAELRQELMHVNVIQGEVVEEGRDSTLPSAPEMDDYVRALFLLDEAFEFMNLMMDVKLNQKMREKLIQIRKDIISFVSYDVMVDE